MSASKIGFDAPVVKGALVRRYKRFFMDVRRDDSDEVVVAHTPNTGSMKGLLDEGNPVLMTYNPSPKRKLHYSVQAIHVGTSWVGCNTHLPNRFVEEAIRTGCVPALKGFSQIRREVKYGREGKSRIDLLLEDHEQGQPHCYVEVKNVTLKDGDVARFPDAVTTRGQKHIRELMDVMDQGFGTALVFLVQRTDCTHFGPADAVDPEYGALLREAHGRGLQIIPLVAKVTAEGVFFEQELPLILT